jgi:LacI family transcriptional regulator
VSKRPTRNDVARVAGVSVATVSYVVNNGPRPVAPQTRAKVLAAIEKLDYKPHAIARSLKTGHTHTIGLVIPTVVSPGQAYLANAVEEILAQHNYSMLLATSREDCEIERRVLELFSSQSIDGLIITPVSMENGDHVRRLLDNGVPVVFADRFIPGVPADIVASDNLNASREAVEFLIERGCEHILCLSFSDSATSALDRVAGYRLALEARGIPFQEERVVVVKTPGGRRAGPALLKYIDEFGYPDGILCTTQMITISVVKTLRELNINIPDQVAIMGGFFDSPWNELLDPPLPLISQDMERLAELVVEFLLKRLQGDTSPPRQFLLDADLITR